MITFSLLLALSTQLGDWDVLELELPTEARCMAPRFSPDGAWLTWVEVAPDGGWVLAGGKLGAAGEPERGQIAAAAREEWFVNWADRPVLSVDATGARVASWLRMSGEGTYAYDALISVSVDEGERWSAPTKLHSDDVQGEHGFVSILPRERGGWAACWLDGRAMGGGHDAHAHPAGDMQLRLAHVDYEGRPQAERVLDERVCECCPTALSALPGGGAVLVYRDRADDEKRNFSYVFCTDPELDRWSSPRVVHDDGWRVDGCPVNGAALASAKDELAVAWFTLGEDAAPKVLCAYWDSEAQAFSAPQRVDAGRPLGRISAAMLPSGELAICWLEELEGAEAAEWRMALMERGGEGSHSQKLLEASATRASGISALSARAEELFFACADVSERRVRAFRLAR